MKLLIVESPSKAKKIQGFLGKDWTVKASAGHVQDLPTRPKSMFGIDLTTWTPEYEVNSKKVQTVKDLRAAAKSADEVYLATDPDREGEGIAQELKSLLGKARYKRAVWHEITKKAVEEGLANCRDIDDHLVAAQESRRIVDRLVGYGISPKLWRDLDKRGLSAGRVQSVALRLVVDRQREIDNFISKPFAAVLFEGRHEASSGQVKAELTKVGRDQIVTPKDAEKPGCRVLSEADARALPLPKPGDRLKVAAVETKRDRKAPKAPFTTSGLMEAASAKLGFSPDRTAKLAQELYQAGAVTYIRTDSPALSEEAIAMARQIVAREYGESNLPKEPRRYKAKGNAQEAHEAIRPTHDDAMPDDVKAMGDDQARLYQLIWQRFLACQMADAESDVTHADLDHGDLRFRATGRVPVFLGWQAVYAAAEDHEDDEEEDGAKLPPLKEGDLVESTSVKIAARKTEPPSPYTEAKLVKELESRGIGRPATYPQIFKTIREREFVVLKKKGRNPVLVPTPLGFQVTDYLVAKFPRYVDYAFTAQVEAQLDEIAGGKLSKKAMLDPFWSLLAPAIGYQEGAASQGGDRAADPDAKKISCFKCKGEMLVRKFDGRHYVKCAKCDHSWGTDAEGTPQGGYCPTCKAPVKVVKSGSKVCMGCNTWLDQVPGAGDGPAAVIACFKCEAKLTVKTYKGAHYVKCETCDLSWATDAKGAPQGGFCPTCKAPVKVTRDGSKVCLGCNTWLTPKSNSPSSNKSAVSSKTGAGRPRAKA